MHLPVPAISVASCKAGKFPNLLGIRLPVGLPSHDLFDGVFQWPGGPDDGLGLCVT